MALLNERKELVQPMEWSGRTNDMKPEKLAGLEDVYTGGRQEKPMDARVEAALTRRDEYGRVMTPKEAFRQLCYKYAIVDPGPPGYSQQNCSMSWRLHDVGDPPDQAWDKVGKV